jgi:mannose-6-phosphate isomerase
MQEELGILRFEEAFFERIWGGNRLRDMFGRPTPTDKTIGEAWLIADHAQCESRVAAGPYAGKTLRDLMSECPKALLGTHARPTHHGRFPLLLKLLDAGQPLSVQVHPDDMQAAALHEPDVGKTEMWYVIDADPGAELICGLDPKASPQTFRNAIEDDTVATLMRTFPAPAGTPVFVPPGTVHAIGAGFLLAEIQQNSDITYRVYDWGRVDDRGIPRALHVDKALQVTRFGSAHGGAGELLTLSDDGVVQCLAAACPYFAAEHLTLSHRPWCRPTDGRSCHLILALTGQVTAEVERHKQTLRPGEAALIPGHYPEMTLAGPGTCLDYYVPHMQHDIITPLAAAGHPEEVIQSFSTAL